MNLIFGKWCFKAGLVPSILALLFFSLFVSLGFWQLDRAEYKKTLYSEFLKQYAVPATDIKEIYDNKNSYQNALWKKFKATGNFLESVQILLDNQVAKSETGYYVYTPFKPEGGTEWILVNRGWVAAGVDRSIIPEMKRTDRVVDIYGVIKDVPRTGLLLQDAAPEKMSKNVYRVQKIDVAKLEQVLNIKLKPVILRLEPESEHGYLKEWRIPGSGEEVHLGYAFQWFAFAATLLIIYLVLTIRKQN